ncbi:MULTISPECIES: hypothetical protein [unclassified Gluconobacter]|uniref:hypothetical protein n=1 Tax=unclassified Gluconobacter TaxID=2644261 RepID=UPI001C04B402|nr:MULTISPECIES: hypothetical protein [unclassified Gluconobacter]
MPVIKLFTGSAKVKHVPAANSYTQPSVRHGSRGGIRTTDRAANDAAEKRRLASQISTNLTQFDKAAPRAMTASQVNDINKKYWN